MSFWELAAGASLIFSLYNAWPELVAGPARRAAQASRYEDAMKAFTSSARFVPAANRNGRVRMFLQAAVAARDAGLPRQSITLGERALAIEQANPVFAILAHGALAQAFAESGDGWSAERHVTIAIEALLPYAEQSSAAQGILGALMTQSAGALLRRGEIRAAIDKATQVIEGGSLALRDASVVIGECAVVQGRFDDALRWFNSARGGPTFPKKGAESRAQGLVALQIAATLASAERPDEVRIPLDYAYQMLGDDLRLRLWCDATALQLRAFSGEPEAIHAERIRLHAEAESRPEDRVTRLRIWSALARTALRVGEAEVALDYFDREANEGLDPVWEARHAYGTGLCHLHLGNDAEAQRAFRQAVSRNLTTYHDRLARRALAEWDVVGGTS